MFHFHLKFIKNRKYLIDSTQTGFDVIAITEARILKNEFPINGINLTNYRLVFTRFLDLCGNLGNGKGKTTRKTCFSREKKRLTPRIYQAKFCLAAFL